MCKHVSDEGNKKAIVTAVKSESDEVVIVDLSTREPSTVRAPSWGYGYEVICWGGAMRSSVGVRL